MRAHEGVVRRYVVGLVMETVPGYRCGEGSEPEHRVLPGLLVRDPVLPRRPGAVALQQAFALLTGVRVSVPPVVSAQGLLRHAQRLLPGFNAQLVWEQAPQDLLALSHDAVHRGGLVLLLWQSIARQVQGSPRLPCPAPQWMLVVGVEGPWRPLDDGSGSAVCAGTSGLLVLNTRVHPAWGLGHNQRLVPGAYPHHKAAARVAEFRAVWSARTVEGGSDCGMVTAALAIMPTMHG
ncbi:hypothetical protein BSY15_4015 [Acidovorax sp. RAC01]|nr:hypothetical protein BSY15_4015 [Acidovorax sp. RAC01]